MITFLNLSQNHTLIAIMAINIASLLAQIVQIGTIAPTLSLFLDDIGATKFQIGLVIAASWLAILLVYKWVPQTISKLGAVNAMLLSTVISVFAVFGMVFSSSVMVLFVLNFILGLGLIVRWVVCDTWLLMLSAKSNRGKVIGTHETLMGLGIAIGPLIIAFTNNDKLDILYISIGLLVLSALITLIIKSANSYPATPKKQYDKNITPLIIIPLVAAGVAGVIETSMISFLPLMYISLGIAAYIATILLSSFGFGGALLQIPIGWLADKTTVQLALVITCLLAVITIIALPFLGTNFLTYAVLFVCGGCISGLNTLAVLEASQQVQDTQLSTSMMLIALVYTVGSIIGPIVTGAVVNYQQYGLLWTSLLFLMLCLIFLKRFFISKTNPESI